MDNTYKLKKVVIASIALIATFFVAGYLLSDDVFYGKTIRANKLTTPIEVYKYVIKNFKRKAGANVHPYASPRHLMEKHADLWCDEGAIIMATLASELGYHTRLIDLIGFDNISHHTILQIQEKQRWINYDFTFHLYKRPITNSALECKFRLKEARIKKYPKTYNFIVNNNFFLKKAIFLVRGIHETAEPD